MDVRKEAEKVMRKEKAFDSKEEALKYALNEIRNLDSDISICKAPPEMGGKYTIVQFENLGEAELCKYKLIFTDIDLYNMVRDDVDYIEEG